MNETRCHICGSEEFEQRQVEYIYRRGGKYLVVRDVPCEICLRCGERYYEGLTLSKIEQQFKSIYEQHVKPRVQIQIPVEVFA